MLLSVGASSMERSFSDQEGCDLGCDIGAPAGAGSLRAYDEYERTSLRSDLASLGPRFARRRRYLTFVATALSNVRRDDGFSVFPISRFPDFQIFRFSDFRFFGFFI